MSEFKNDVHAARKLWVEDLRSDPAQCNGALCELDGGKPAGWCCLGRACEVFCRSEHQLRLKDFDGKRSYAGADTTLPDEVAEWLGLQNTAGRWNQGDGSLWWMNDSGRSFAEIADVIESAPPGLFVEAP